VPHREHYVPKHLGPKHPSAKESNNEGRSTRSPLAARLRSSLVVSGAAVAVTGLAVAGGVLTESSPVGDPAAAALAAHQAHSASDPSSASARAASTDRVDRVISRSETRSAIDTQKARALNQQRSGGQVTKRVNQTPDLSSADPRTIAKTLLAREGYGEDQFSCLDSIYSQESGWNVHAANPTSSAYGIPQALPGSKMASAGPNWESDAATQIRWGLGYIKGRYGSPCSAWGFKEAHGWY
jgi:hypothetical protein